MRALYNYNTIREGRSVLSKEDLKSLLNVEGEEILEIPFRECKAGDVFRITDILGNVFLLELTVPISGRADIYEVKGGDLSAGGIFHGNCHFIYPVRIAESTSFGGKYIPRLSRLKKVRSA